MPGGRKPRRMRCLCASIQNGFSAKYCPMHPPPPRTPSPEPPEAPPPPTGRQSMTVRILAHLNKLVDERVKKRELRRWLHRLNSAVRYDRCRAEIERDFSGPSSSKLIRELGEACDTIKDFGYPRPGHTGDGQEPAAKMARMEPEIWDDLSAEEKPSRLDEPLEKVDGVEQQLIPPIPRKRGGRGSKRCLCAVMRTGFKCRVCPAHRPPRKQRTPVPDEITSKKKTPARLERDAGLTQYFFGLPPQHQVALVKLMARLQEPYPDEIAAAELELVDDTMETPTVEFPKEFLWMTKNREYFEKRAAPSSRLEPVSSSCALPAHQRSSTSREATNSPGGIYGIDRCSTSSDEADEQLEDGLELEPEFCCHNKHCQSGEFKCFKKREREAAAAGCLADATLLVEPKPVPIQPAAGEIPGICEIDWDELMTDLPDKFLPAQSSTSPHDEATISKKLDAKPEFLPGLPGNNFAYAVTKRCAGCALPLTLENFYQHRLLLTQGLKCPGAKFDGSSSFSCAYKGCTATFASSGCVYGNHLRMRHIHQACVLEQTYVSMFDFQDKLKALRELGDFEGEHAAKITGRTYPCRYTHDPNDSDDEPDDCIVKHDRPIVCPAFYQARLTVRENVKAVVLRLYDVHIHQKMRLPRAVRHRIRQLARFLPIFLVASVIRAEAPKYAGEGGLRKLIDDLDAVEIARIVGDGNVVAPDFDPANYTLPELPVIEALDLPQSMDPRHIRAQCDHWIKTRKDHPLMCYKKAADMSKPAPTTSARTAQGVENRVLPLFRGQLRQRTPPRRAPSIREATPTDSKPFPIDDDDIPGVSEQTDEFNLASDSPESIERVIVGNRTPAKPATGSHDNESDGEDLEMILNFDDVIANSPVPEELLGDSECTGNSGIKCEIVEEVVVNRSPPGKPTPASRGNESDGEDLEMIENFDDVDTDSPPRLIPMRPMPRVFPLAPSVPVAPVVPAASLAPAPLPPLAPPPSQRPAVKLWREQNSYALGYRWASGPKP